VVATSDVADSVRNRRGDLAAIHRERRNRLAVGTRLVAATPTAVAVGTSVAADTVEAVTLAEDIPAEDTQAADTGAERAEKRSG
jgi:hypothetical protein